MSDLLKRVLLEQPLTNEAQALLADLQPGAARLISKQFVIEQDPWKDPNPRFVFEYARPDGEEVRRVQEYSESLDAQLYKWHVQMDKPEEESLRLGTRLLSNLRYADVAFGKDYSDHVFWEIASDRFGHVSLIRQVLDQVAHYSPELTPQYAEARNYLESCVTGLGNSVRLELLYEEPRAFALLAGAVWYVMEQRHSLQLRRLLALRKQ